MRYKVLLVAILLLAFLPAMTEDADGAKTFGSPDGIEYAYETFGSQHSEYRSTIVSASSDSGMVVLASALEGYEVRDIADGAFDFPNARLIVIPSSIGTIGAGAFDSCPNLEAVLFMGDMPEIAGGLPTGVMAEMLSDVVFSGMSSDGSVIEYAEIDGEAMAVGGMARAVLFPSKNRYSVIL